MASRNLFRIALSGLPIVLVLASQTPCRSQQQNLSFDDVKSAAKRRADAIDRYQSDVGSAVQSFKSSPRFEGFAEARLDHLSAIWDWQAAEAAGDKRKAALRRSIMEEAEKRVRSQLEQSAELRRLVTLSKARGEIESSFADARGQMNRMKSIPNSLYDLDRQITTLESASAKTNRAIESAKAKNANVADPEKKQRNAALITKAELHAKKTNNKIAELKSIRSKFERDLHTFTRGNSLADSKDVLRRQLSQVKDQLRLAERELKDVNSVLDAILFLSSSPKLKEVQGAAQIRRADGNTVPAREVKSLQPGDAITTGKSSSVTATLEDGSELTVGSSTGVEISNKGMTSEIGLDIGSIHFKANFSYVFGRTKAWFRKATSRRFRVRTPNASIGVRGTEFLMQFDPKGITHIFLRSGTLELPLKDGETKQLSAGTYFTLQKDGTAGGVKEITDQEFFEAVDRMVN
jgi:hypothetical protein